MESGLVAQVFFFFIPETMSRPVTILNYRLIRMKVNIPFRLKFITEGRNFLQLSAKIGSGYCYFEIHGER